MRATSNKLITILAAAFLAAALLAPAANAGETVPPGNGEADQYAETVPGAAGDETPGGTLQPDDVLPAGQVDQLESGDGTAGSGLTAFVAATAPSNGTTGGAGAAAGGDGGSGADGTGSEGDGAGVPSPAAAAATGPGEDGLGGSLWLIIALVAAGAIAFAVRQRSAAAHR